MLRRHTLACSSRTSQVVTCVMKPYTLKTTPAQPSRRDVLHGVGTLASMMACPCCLTLPAKADGFNYDVISGPEGWQGTCAVGQRQSPVNVPMKKPIGEEFAGVQNMNFRYGQSEKVAIKNTGHGTMQVNFAPGNLCIFQGRELELLQYHFHTPSEHALDGQRYAMEAHLVHKDRLSGRLAVLGVLLAPGAAEPNIPLQMGLDYAPTEPGKEVSSGQVVLGQVLLGSVLCQWTASKTVSPVQLLPEPNRDGQRPHVLYTGSLTTPPCSEEVDWVVFTTPVRITDKQVLDFMQFAGGGLTYGKNARPLQPFNERTMQYDLV